MSGPMVRRAAQIKTAGQTGNVELATAEDVAFFESKKGSLCRITGPLSRRRGVDGCQLNFIKEKLLLQGMPGWTDPTDEELEDGFTFDGMGKVVSKNKFTNRDNITYRSIQVTTMGDIFRLTDLEPELFEKLPEGGMIAVYGYLSEQVSNSRFGKVVDYMLDLENFYAEPTRPEVKPAEPQNKAGYL